MPGGNGDRLISRVHRSVSPVELVSSIPQWKTQEKTSEVEIDLWPPHIYLEMCENMYVYKHMKEQTHI